MSTPAARRLWWAIEPFHGVAFSAPEIGEMYERSGILDGRVGSVATRLAPLGQVSPGVARAALSGFAPSVVDAAVPGVWGVIGPDALVVRRLHAIDQAMWRLLGNDLIRSNELVAASQLARRAAEHADCSARLLAASYQSLEWPTFPHLVLWQAVTVLREHRSDGEAAARMIAGLSPLEGQVLVVADGASTSDLLRDIRGWSEDEWEQAVADLRDRGLLTKLGGLTDEGRELHNRIEQQTDDLASGAYDVLSEDEQAQLRKTLEVYAKEIVSAGEFTYPNEIGVPEPPAGLHRRALDPGSAGSSPAAEEDEIDAEHKDVDHEDGDEDTDDPVAEGADHDDADDAVDEDAAGEDGDDEVAAGEDVDEAVDEVDADSSPDVPDDEVASAEEPDGKSRSGDSGRKGARARARRGPRS